MQGRSRRIRKLLLAALLGMIALSLGASPALATIYYVSPSGNNSNPGTLASPFLTIAKCSSVAISGDTCRMRAGTYRETVIPPSGTIYEPYNSEHVVIDGTDPVTGWTVHSGNIYRASVNLDWGDAERRNHVFVGGSLVHEARYPNSNGNLFAPNWATMGAGTDYNTINDASLPAINWTGATVHSWAGTAPFAHKTATVTSSSSGSFETNFANDDTCPYLCARPNGRYYLVGKLSALDTAGEWYYDAGTDRLYLWAPGGGSPTNVVAKKREFAFDLRTRSNVTVRNMTIFGATIVTNFASVNNAIDGISATYISHHETLPLPQNPVYDEGAWNIVASRENDTGFQIYGMNNEVINSEISYSAGAGIRLGGHDNAASNNHIHHIGYGGSYATAINVSGYNQTVHHNTIHDTGRDGINIDWHVNGLDFFNNDIGYNAIFTTNRLSPDGGGIDACCELDASGTEIHHNWVHDAQITVGISPSGIYIDNASGYFNIHQNVTWDNPHSGIFLHGGGGPSNGNWVHDNTSYGEQEDSIWVLNVSDGTDTVIENNKVSTPLNLMQAGAGGGDIAASNNTPTAPGADEGIVADAGCDLNAACESEAPPNTEVVMTRAEPAVSSWGSGQHLFALGLGSLEIRYSQLAGWSGLGGTMRSAPTVASWSPTRQDVFAVGKDSDTIYWKTNNGGWSSYSTLSGPAAGIAAGPAAVSRTTNSMDLFVVGYDGVVYQRTYTSGTWGSWASIGAGTRYSTPAVVAHSSTSMDLFVLGPNNSLYQKSYSSGTWGAWTSLTTPPGGATSAPSVTTRAAGNLELFVRGGDEAFYRRSYNSGSWSSWEFLDGIWKSGPAVVSLNANNIELYGRGMDADEIWHRSWNNGSWGPYDDDQGTP